MAMDEYHHVQIRDDNPEDVFKLLVIGDSNVGKSCLVSRFFRGCFVPDTGNTIGVAIKIQNIAIDGKEVSLQIWDSAGFERFRIMISNYYRGANGIIIVYDVTNKSSFENLSNWIKEIQLHAPETATKVVVGNKCDLISERAVAPHLVECFSKTHNIPHFETSARTGQNVEEIFFSISSRIARKRKYSQSYWIEKNIFPQEEKEPKKEPKKEIVNSDSYEIYEMIHKVETIRQRRGTRIQDFPPQKPRKTPTRSLKGPGICLCCNII